MSTEQRRERLRIMLEMQEKLNGEIVPDWRARGLAWHRAVWTECAELMDYLPWKWWRESSCQLKQMQLEVVDIWHFGLSQCLEQGTPQEVAAVVWEEWRQCEEEAAATEVEGMEVVAAVETLVQHALQRQEFSLAAFRALLQATAMTEQQLFRLYVEKNMLNRFRRDHGYREGRYQKIWAGHEDNHWLERIAASLDSALPDYPRVLYQALEDHYRQLALPAGVAPKPS